MRIVRGPIVGDSIIGGPTVGDAHRPRHHFQQCPSSVALSSVVLSSTSPTIRDAHHQQWGVNIQGSWEMHAHAVLTIDGYCLRF